MTNANVVGAILSCIASIVSNVGVNVQKHAHNINDARPMAQRVNYMKMPVWWMGLLCVIAGAIGDFIALGIAAQSLVTALGGATTLSATRTFSSALVACTATSSKYWSSASSTSMFASHALEVLGPRSSHGSPLRP